VPKFYGFLIGSDRLGQLIDDGALLGIGRKERCALLGRAIIGEDQRAAKVGSRCTMGSDGCGRPRRHRSVVEHGRAIAGTFGKLCQLRQIAAVSQGLHRFERPAIELQRPRRIKLRQDGVAHQLVPEGDHVSTGREKPDLDALGEVLNPGAEHPFQHGMLDATAENGNGFENIASRRLEFCGACHHAIAQGFGDAATRMSQDLGKEERIARSLPVQCLRIERLAFAHQADGFDR
jgi:hypothetical protein